MRYPAALLAALVSSVGLVAAPASAKVAPASCTTIFDLPGAKRCLTVVEELP